MINSLLNRYKAKSSSIKLYDDYGNIVNYPQEIAEKFNNYFSTIADKLKSQTCTSENLVNNHKTFMCNPVSNSIYLMPTHATEINDTINSLKLKTTSDTKIKALKAAATIPSFNHILTSIVNLSFENGVFPTQLKLAKVVPIHKNGSKTEVSNYRPISLLPTFSKIFEKLMHSRVYHFLESNKSLCDTQYGFRSGRSCEHALLVAQNEILASLSNKQISLLLLIDFSKAFDMVDHNILLDKLYYYGIRGIAHKWFQSYLHDRKQYVTIKGKSSSTSSLNYSVPQGSILGPLLFIIYINDIPNISKTVKFVLYADDANIIITANSIHEIESQFSELGNALTKWVSCNGLSLNIKKTQYMIFTRKRNLNFESFIPKIDNIPIERKNVTRFLGVLVDDKLSWTQQIAALKSKMSRYIGIAYKLRSILPISARQKIFNSQVQCHLNYCSLVWGTSCKSNIDTLFQTQKKAMRSIMPGHVNYYYKDGVCPSHTKPAFTDLKILTVQNVILKNILIFINKIHNFPSMLPLSVKSTISCYAPSPNSVSDYDYNSDWYSTYNTKPYNSSTFFKGPLLYTDIITKHPLLLTNTSIHSFKKNVKKHLLEVQCSGNIQEWEPTNFTLANIPGLRSSKRLKMQNHQITIH